MNKDKINQLNQGFNTAFIDYTAASNLAYRPQFVSNNYKEGRKVISSIEDELLSCEQFTISVSSDVERIGAAWNSRKNFDNRLSYI